MSPRKRHITTPAAYVGIDNGSTGSIGVIRGARYFFQRMPTKKEQDYTKKKKNVTRLTPPAFRFWLGQVIRGAPAIRLMIERPLVNPGRFVATASALRFLEATMIVLEEMELPIEFIDSRKWQKVLLPVECKGPELKTASRHIGCRMFPKVKEEIISHGDADGLLIAEYCKRMNR